MRTLPTIRLVKKSLQRVPGALAMRPAAASAHPSLLHWVLEWAEMANLRHAHVARIVQVPKAAPSPARALTPAQVAMILTAS